MDRLARMRKEIREAMIYGVPEGMLSEAAELIDRYHDDLIGLTLLHEFYHYLPEAQGTCVLELRLMARQRGVFLLVALSEDQGYQYLVSDEGVEFQGALASGYLDRDLLDYFGFAGEEDFQQRCRDPYELPVYEPLQVDMHVCPACHVATGEEHELGCPVEICPWCGGQLIHCDCRFELLEEDFVGEEGLRRFEEMLRDRGRLPYAPEQRPHFADDGGGVILD